jgi:hypothetical protein
LAVLAIGIASAGAGEMRPPRISPVAIDWGELSAELQALHEETGTVDEQANRVPASAADAIARINRVTGERFPNIEASPVPVLLPFDTPAFMRDREGVAVAPSYEAADYLLGFNSVPFFYAGPSGYDAVIVARAQELGEAGIAFSSPIYIHIGGSTLLYELDEPARLIERPAPRLPDFPGLRRVYLENYARYIFVRYGVPYVIAIECFDGRARFGKMSCRDADKVAIRALNALHFAGGRPQALVGEGGADTIDRPAGRSAEFTYHSPGNIIPSTGFRHGTGTPDYSVYSRIRFPIAQPPAFASSQRFVSWGNCEPGAAYAAEKRSDTPAAAAPCHGPRRVRDEAVNYSYPWRDDFCESRGFYVGQCPSGLGHQGQDLMPARCKQRGLRARCEPYLYEVVAVSDGAVLRAPRQESLYIVVNAANEHLRFRYLHMGPKPFEAVGLLSGRLIREGEVIGKVGNFFRREGATSTHLHFDLQVHSKYGWVFVNPYMTLVAAYERLIGGRGREIMDEIVPPLSPAYPPPRASQSPAQPGQLAAKPTETALESAPATEIDSGIRRDAPPNEHPLVTTSVPAAPPRSDVQREGPGAGD